MPDAGDLSILALSLQVALVATVVVVPLGVALAWSLVGWRGPVRIAIESVLALPLVLPPSAVGIVLLMLLGGQAPLGRWLESIGIEIAFTWRAAALASA